MKKLMLMVEAAQFHLVVTEQEDYFQMLLLSNALNIQEQLRTAGSALLTHAL
jgi:hypothetical protein